MKEESKSPPDPLYILPEKTYWQLKDDFREKYVSKNTILQALFKRDWEEKAKGIKPISNEAVRKFLCSQTYTFRESTLEGLCQVLYYKKFQVWLRRFSPEQKPRLVDRRLSSKNRASQTENFKGHLSLAPESIVEGLLSSASEEIWFFGASLDRSLDVGKDLFVEALSKGVKMNILFLIPENNHLDILARELNLSVNEVSTRCSLTLTKTLELMKAWRDEGAENFRSERICARITNNFPRMQCYISDPKNTSAKSFFIPTISKSSSIRLPVLECHNVSEGIAAKYFQCLQHEWRDSTLIQQFLSNNPNLVREEDLEILKAYLSEEIST
ncbi:MAG: hypothetical protein HC895_00175 [Leptolyngbyaceae cyanobacterium SM1_3_5]|nr:hypothetical protein [Leptolyngbyaceae cyanobacterium SM1_3_5]